MMGERIKELRKDFRLTQNELADKLGIKPTTLSNYENDVSEPPLETVMKILRLFSTGFDWLITGKGLKSVVYEDDLQRSIYLTESTFRQGSIVYLPVLDAKVSAGYGIENFNVKVTDKFGVEEKLVFPYKAEKLKVLPVSGDSMYPTLIEGDFIVVAEGVIDGNGIYVLNRGGHLFVKRLHFKMTEKKLAIISDNKNYPPEEIKEDGIGEYFAIVGMVILHIHRSR